MENWWINGRPGRHIDVADRGFTYGDGLFETIAVRNGEARFLALHLDRLLGGCARLRIAAPERAGLQASLAAAALGIRHGVLKLIVTRGAGPRGYGLPAEQSATVVWGTMDSEPRPSGPIEIRWCETMVSVNPATAGLKTLGRLEQVLARAEWTAAQVVEGLMTTIDGQLIGGTSSNVFVVAGNRVLTPALHRAGVAGVMRRVVMAEARRDGIELVETALTPFEVHDATELFVSNALTGIRPVCRLDSRTFTVGPVTRRLRELLVAAGVGECAEAS
ncbi:MAG: aminodeoxychorismate lyase [Gammaproteobacteria bacterium]|nr:aminodeoxychorismate lyase [Gammaproteobacteria bacterium]